MFNFSVVLGVVTTCFQADSSGKLSVHDGQLLDLNCISKGGKPAAGIDWKMEGSVVKENVASRSELESNGFRFTSISTLKLKVSVVPAGCRVEHSQGTDLKTCLYWH